MVIWLCYSTNGFLVSAFNFYVCKYERNYRLFFVFIFHFSLTLLFMGLFLLFILLTVNLMKLISMFLFVCEYEDLKVHIDQHAIYQTVYRLKNIPFTVTLTRRIHRAAHVVRHGRDLNRKVCSVWIPVHGLYDQHRLEKMPVCPPIVSDPVQWTVIHRMIQRRAKG